MQAFSELLTSYLANCQSFGEAIDDDFSTIFELIVGPILGKLEPYLFHDIYQIYDSDAVEEDTESDEEEEDVEEDEVVDAEAPNRGKKQLTRSSKSGRKARVVKLSELLWGNLVVLSRDFTSVRWKQIRWSVDLATEGRSRRPLDNGLC